MEKLLSDSVGFTVKLPATLSLEEVARELYPDAFKENRTPNDVLREWGYANADCANLKNDLRIAESRVASGESPEQYRLHTRRKQVQVAELVLQKMFEEACQYYFTDHPRNWPAYVMSKDKDASSKDWHFFFSRKDDVCYRSWVYSDTRTSRAFDECGDRLSRHKNTRLKVYHGINWHVAAPADTGQICFTAPERATYRPSSYEGNLEGAVEWAKRERVLYLKVSAGEVHAILDRFKTVEIKTTWF